MSIEPGKIAAGDSLSWSRRVSDYPAGDYTLHYALINAGAAYTIDGTADGTAHRIAVDSDTTGTWLPGRYDWTAYITGPDNFRRSLFTGVMIITPDHSQAHDARTHARRMLDAIEAALEGRATADEMDLIKGQWGDRAIERKSAELIVARDKYRQEAEAEERAAALARGERLSGNIKVRFTR